MAADRAQHVAEVIEPALDAGRTVICDRFAGSSIAYQGHGRQLPAAEVEQLSRWATQGRWPDLVVLLEVAARGRPRGASRRARDRLESAGDAFHRRVHDGYLLQAMEDPDRWAIVDGTGSEDEVAAAVWDIVTHPVPRPRRDRARLARGGDGDGDRRVGRRRRAARRDRAARPRPRRTRSTRTCSSARRAPASGPRPGPSRRCSCPPAARARRRSATSASPWPRRTRTSTSSRPPPRRGASTRPPPRRS